MPESAKTTHVLPPGNHARSVCQLALPWPDAATAGRGGSPRRDKPINVPGCRRRSGDSTLHAWLTGELCQADHRPPLATTSKNTRKVTNRAVMAMLPVTVIVSGLTLLN